MKTIQNKLLSAVILLILATINCTAQNRFPDGETRYYATADKSIISTCNSITTKATAALYTRTMRGAEE